MDDRSDNLRVSAMVARKEPKLAAKLDFCSAELWAAPMVDKMVWRLAVSMVALLVACLGTVMVAAMADLMARKWVVPQAACLAALWVAPMVDKMV